MKEMLERKDQNEEEKKEEPLSEDDPHLRVYQIQKRKYSFLPNYEEFKKERVVLDKIAFILTNNQVPTCGHQHPLFLQGPFKSSDLKINSIWTCARGD